MPNVARILLAAMSLIAICVAIGCRSGGQTRALPSLPVVASECESSAIAIGAGLEAPNVTDDVQLEPGPLPLIQTVSHLQVGESEGTLPDPSGTDQLRLDTLIAEVVARNPDIRSAMAAWRAAAQRYPQEISLDDPMFGYMLGPASWGSDTVDSAYLLEVSQKVPWPGKRQLRGNMAQAEANVAYFNAEEQRLRIVEATKFAFYEYYLAHRQLAVLEESTSLLQSFREIALRRFESAETEQQDVLLADVELAQLKRQRLALVRAERVARARVNTLLLVPADRRLPSPPRDAETHRVLPSSEELFEMALSQRPELAGQAARIRRERYSAALARKEFLPDMEFVARYDAFWQEEELRPMVGMNVNVPIYKSKRWAAVREANARSVQQQATLESQINEIGYAVESAYQRVEESEQTINVYTQQILPSARHSIEAAEASYTAGRLDFLRLVESQRQLLTLQDEYYRSVAEYNQRLAELEREVGIDLE